MVKLNLGRYKHWVLLSLAMQEATTVKFHEAEVPKLMAPARAHVMWTGT